MDAWPYTNIVTGSGEIAGAGSFDVTLSRAAVAGEYLVLFSQNVDGAPAGFTSLASTAGVSSTARIHYKAAAGGEQTVSCSTVSNQAEAHLLCFDARSGLPDGGGFVDGGPTITANGTAATISPTRSATNTLLVMVSATSNITNVVSSNSEDHLIDSGSGGPFHDSTFIVARRFAGSAPGATYSGTDTVFSTIAFAVELDYGGGFVDAVFFD